MIRYDGIIFHIDRWNIKFWFHWRDMSIFERYMKMDRVIRYRIGPLCINKYPRWV